MTTSSHRAENNLGVKFHSGHGEFSKVWFLHGSQEIYQNLFDALNYSMFGLNPDDRYTSTSLKLTDQDGIQWEVIRKKRRSLVLKGGQTTRLTPQEILGSATMEDPEKASGMYQLSFDHNEIFMSSLSPAGEKEQINFQFLKENSQNLLRSLQLSFDHPAWGKLSRVKKLAPELESLWPHLHPQIRQRQSVPEEDKLKSSGIQEHHQATSLEELRVQVQAMGEIKSLLDRLSHPGTGLLAISEKIKKTESQFNLTLTECKLNEFNENKIMIDWNIPLQCLCYVNVLDQLIPVLSGSLEQIRSFFQLQLANNQKSGQKITKNIGNLKTMLTNYRKVLDGGLNHIEDFITGSERPDKQSLFSALIPMGRKKGLAKGTLLRVRREVESLRTCYNKILKDLESIRFDNSTINGLVKPLEEFLNQTILKKESLIQHWKILCQELGIPETINLHNFLEMIIKLNELLILNQKLRSLNDGLTDQKNMLLALKKLVTDWHSATGSQKILCLKNTQMILSEAHNIIRYQNEKLRQLKGMEKNQLELALSRRFATKMAQTRKDLQLQWSEAFSHAGVPEISFEDPRASNLIEKLRLITAIDYLKSHVVSLGMQSAFSEDWEYEAICFWTMAQHFSDYHQVRQILKGLRRISATGYHILLVRNSDHTPALRQAGLGQISPFWEDVPGRTGAGMRLDKNISEDGHPLKTNKSATIQNHEKNPGSVQGKNEQILSPQVQAVVELLNGGAGS